MKFINSYVRMILILLLLNLLSQNFANAFTIKNKSGFATIESFNSEKKINLKKVTSRAEVTKLEKKLEINSISGNKIKRLSKKTAGTGDITTTTISCETGVMKKVCGIFKLNFKPIKIQKQTSESGVKIVTVTLPDFNLANLTKGSKIEKLVNQIGLSSLSLTNSEASIAYDGIYGAKLHSEINFLNVGTKVDLIASSSSGSSVAFFAGVNAKFKLFQEIAKKFLGKLIDEKKFDENNPFSYFSDSDIFLLISYNGVDFDKLKSWKPQYYDKVARGEEKSFIKIQSSIRLNDNPDSKVIQFLKKYLPKELNLSVRFNEESIRSEIALTDLDFGNKLKISKAAIFLDILPTKNPQLEFGIRGVLSFPLKGTTLTLEGDLLVTPISAGFRFKMIGVISSVFGIPRLHFGNFRLATSFSYANGVPTYFKADSEISIGLNCYKQNTFVGDKTCIKAVGGVGIDILNPTGNYFYLTVSTLSFSQIANAFAGTESKPVNVPKMLEESLKLPQGFFVSFSGKEIKENNINIKTGFFLKATIQIFSKSAELEFAIQPSLTSLSFKAKISILQPINFGKFLTVENSSDKNKGPLMDFGLDTKDGISITGELDGALTIFGLRVVTKLSFANNFFKFFISGNIKTFLAQLEGEVRIESSGFIVGVKGSLDVGSLKDIVKYIVKKFIDKIKSKSSFRFVESFSDAKSNVPEKKLPQPSSKPAVAPSPPPAQKLSLSDRFKNKIKDKVQGLIDKGTIFDIKKISFDFKLDTTTTDITPDTKKLIMKVNIDAIIMGKDKNFKIDWDFNSKSNTMENIFNAAFKKAEEEESY